MSLILMIVLLSLLMILPLMFFSIHFSLQSQQHPHHLLNNSNNNIFQSYLTFSNLSSFWKLLLRPSISISHNSSPAVRFTLAGEDSPECCVCLSKIEIGEEIRELTCRHVFHQPCLDAWIGTGRATCPLCRGRVASPVEDHAGAEVLSFRFCSLSSFRDEGQENWWLR